jgi:hypothetical protein
VVGRRLCSEAQPFPGDLQSVLIFIGTGKGAFRRLLTKPKGSSNETVTVLDAIIIRTVGVGAADASQRQGGNL